MAAFRLALLSRYSDGREEPYYPEDPSPVDVEEFLRDNESLDDEDRAAVRALAVGEEFLVGGGAGEAAVVRRVA